MLVIKIDYCCFVFAGGGKTDEDLAIASANKNVVIDTFFRKNR